MAAGDGAGAAPAPAPDAAARGIAPDGAARGIVYAATGRPYVTLARRAARTVRRLMPDVPIDLYTDEAPDDPVFDRVHLLERVDRRPKIEALIRTRFDLALYLDADTVMLAPVHDVFDVVAGCDLAMAVEAYRGDKRNLSGPTHVPPAFPPFNSGVIAFNASDRTRDFARRWAEAFRAGAAEHPYDQRALRETAYASDLSIRTLPREYNLMWIAGLLDWDERRLAPRILHLPRLHQGRLGDPEAPFDLKAIVPPRQRAALRALLRADPTLAAPPGGWGIEAPPMPLGRRVPGKGIRPFRDRFEPPRHAAAPAGEDP